MPNPPGTIINAASASMINNGAPVAAVQGAPYVTNPSSQAAASLDRFDDMIRAVASGSARPNQGPARSAAIVVTDIGDAITQEVAKEMKQQGYRVSAVGNNVKVSW